MGSLCKRSFFALFSYRHFSIPTREKNKESLPTNKEELKKYLREEDFKEDELTDILNKKASAESFSKENLFKKLRVVAGIDTKEVGEDHQVIKNIPQEDLENETEDEYDSENEYAGKYLNYLTRYQHEELFGGQSVYPYPTRKIHYDNKDRVYKIPNLKSVRPVLSPIKNAMFISDDEGGISESNLEENFEKIVEDAEELGFTEEELRVFTKYAKK